MIGDAWICRFSVEWSQMSPVVPLALTRAYRPTKWTDPRVASAAVHPANGRGILDLALLLGPGERVVDAARKLVRSMCGIDRYEFNIGYGVMPRKPPNTVKAVLDAVRKGS